MTKKSNDSPALAPQNGQGIRQKSISVGWGRERRTTGGDEKVNEPNPITYRMLHEEAAGMGLCSEFFQISGINPDAPVTCNCKFDNGHEAACDIVAAMKLRRKIQNDD